jgi:hypothetical protein
MVRDNSSNKKNKYTYLVLDTELAKKASKLNSQIETRMRLGDLNDIQQEGNGDPLAFKMDGKRAVRLVIGGCPTVVSEMERAFVFL